MIFIKDKLAKVITAQKGRRNFKTSKASNSYEVIF